jgi:hypothetical protein
MASNDNDVRDAITRVVAAYERTTQPTKPDDAKAKEQKNEALQYLESFQKSVRRTAVQSPAKSSV